MCLTIVEILMAITGVWALFSGKPPAGLFKVLFGKGEYKADPKQARLIGLLLVSPLPLAFLAGIIGSLSADPSGAGILAASLIEILIVIVVSTFVFWFSVK